MGRPRATGDTGMIPLLTFLGLLSQAPPPEIRYDFAGAEPYAVDSGPLRLHGLVRDARRIDSETGPALALGEKGRVVLPPGKTLLGERPTEGTIALWVKPSFAPGELSDGLWDGYRVFIYIEKTSGNGLPDGANEIGIWAHGSKLLAKVEGTGYGPFAAIDSPLRKDTWAHLAITWQPGRRWLYVNGAQVAANTQGYETPILDSFAGAIGYHPSSGKWNVAGPVAKVLIAPRALPPEEIAGLGERG